jgi:hypothetical protein
MKHLAISLGLGALFISCGGKANPASSGGATAPAPSAASIPDGIHGCTFTDTDGYTYGPHRCDVAEGTIEKLSGMELFTGTLTPSGDGVLLEGLGAAPFTIELKREGAGWRGPVVLGKGGEWWLAGATFEITHDAGYGGDTYGGATYGGAE